MTRPLHKHINTAALADNWRAVRKKAHAPFIWAVLKSDAYGHGIRAAADALAADADGFGVVDIADAAWLRKRLPNAPILLMQGFFAAADLPALCAQKIHIMIHSEWQLQAILDAGANSALTVHVKINTGMNRLGFPPTEALDVVARLRRAPAVAKIVLATHFANADKPDGLRQPLAVFAPIRAAFPDCEVSLGNSAATLLHGDIQDGQARVGIALYGSSPAPQWASRDTLGLSAVMTLHSRLSAIHSVDAGAQIGYGSTFTAPQPMQVGIVPVGYSSGYPRGDNLHVECGAQRCPVLGRVSMEMIAADISAVAGARVGSPVILWGDSPDIDDIAARAGTIGYDLLTRATAIPGEIAAESCAVAQNKI